MIRKTGSGYEVLSSNGSKHLGGPYKTRAEAEARLRQVEHFKKEHDRSPTGGMQRRPKP